MEKNIWTVESIKSQTDGRMRFDEAIMFEERSWELEIRIKQKRRNKFRSSRCWSVSRTSTQSGWRQAVAAEEQAEGEPEANTAAAKEKTKSTGDKLRSHNNRNEKAEDGKDAIKRLIEERRNITKGDKQQQKEENKKNKKVH